MSLGNHLCLPQSTELPLLWSTHRSFWCAWWRNLWGRLFFLL